MAEGNAVVEERVTSNSYQMSLEIDPDGRDPIVESVAQAGSWLRGRKNWDPTLDASGFQNHDSAAMDLLTLHHESSSGREFRMRLTEHTPVGVWRTQLTVAVPRSEPPWVALQVSNSEGRWAAVPGLAKNLLEALTTRDGMSAVSPEPMLVTQTNVEEFLERLTDPDRRGLFFVAGTAPVPFDFAPFRKQVGRWANQVRGLAQTAVLTPDATEVVADALGASHAVSPWTLRTFYPETDPAIRSDGYRHKWLTTERLGRERDSVIQQLLGRIARKHAFQRPGLDGYGAVDRTLRRLEDKTLVDSLLADLPRSHQQTTRPVTVELGIAGPSTSVDVGATPALDVANTIDSTRSDTADSFVPSSTTALADLQQEADRLRAILDLVKTTLSLEEVTTESLAAIAQKAASSDVVSARIGLFEAQLAEREDREASLEVRVVELQRSFDDAQLDVRESGESAARLSDENRYLKQRLADLEDFEGAYGNVPPDAYTQYPENFEELLDQCVTLEGAGVVFTGARSETLALDEHDTLGNAVRAAWDGFLSLVDYLRARSSDVCATGIREYMRETPAGYRSMPTNKFGGKETKETMRRWGGERRFPVPTEADPSGSAVMEAHFKLAPIGMVSPRMYFLDCYATTGKVYVGYIGAHLTNTMT